MTRLAEYLRDYSGPLEASLQAEYGLDLGALWRGDVTFRKVGVLAAGLPPGCALWRAMGVDDAWTGEGHLLAEVIDRLNALIAVFTGEKKYDLFPRPHMQANGSADPKQAAEDYATTRARLFLERQKQREEA